MTRLLIVFLCICIISGCSGKSPKLVPTRIPSPILPSGEIFERAYRIGRAVNLGNALEAPSEGEWGVRLQEEYFSLIKNAGFSAVRIPIRFSNHAALEAPYTIDPVFFERVDWAVNQALGQGLVAIIDMHHYLEIFEKPYDHKERFLGMWKQIAERYQGYSPDVYFELLNEPNGKLTTQLWGEFAAEAVELVRRTNPTRPILLGPGEWNSASQLVHFTVPEDENLIITFHYYSPFHFTHQGAEWAPGSEEWLGTNWDGSDSLRWSVRSDLNLAARWGKENNRPIFLGEFGAYSKADMDSRVLWTDAVARTAEELGISWAYWEFCAGFGVYDPVAGKWNEAILGALIPEQ